MACAPATSDFLICSIAGWPVSGLSEVVSKTTSGFANANHSSMLWRDSVSSLPAHNFDTSIAFSLDRQPLRRVRKPEHPPSIPSFPRPPGALDHENRGAPTPDVSESDEAESVSF